MAIRFRCQNCSGLMSIANRKAGTMVPCAMCGAPTLVPLEDIFDAAAKAAAGAIEDSPLPPSVSAVPIQTETPPPEIVEPPRDAEASLHFEIGDEDDEAPPLTLRRRKRIDDDMDLTPMVDVTFQLLIFFMVTASFALQKSIQVPTPDPDQKGATQQMQTLDDLQGTSILVRIDAANAILIDDEPLADPSQLTDVLRDKMRKEQKTELLLTAHTAALHRGVIAVIDAANEVGMQKIRLASRKGKDD
jgi:biopolymer transport protein ExbD